MDLFNALRSDQTDQAQAPAPSGAPGAGSPLLMDPIQAKKLREGMTSQPSTLTRLWNLIASGNIEGK